MEGLLLPLFYHLPLAHLPVIQSFHNLSFVQFLFINSVIGIGILNFASSFSMLNDVWSLFKFIKSYLSAIYFDTYSFWWLVAGISVWVVFEELLTIFLAGMSTVFSIELSTIFLATFSGVFFEMVSEVFLIGFHYSFCLEHLIFSYS